MSTQRIAALDREIAQAKAEVEFGKALERLKQNKDFQLVVLDGYFKNEAVRLVHLKGDPNMQSMDSQDSIVKQIDAISAFNAFMTTGFQKAAMAEKTLDSADELRDEILAEELNHG
jgi:hypothetical protein